MAATAVNFYSAKATAITKDDVTDILPYLSNRKQKIVMKNMKQLINDPHRSRYGRADKLAGNNSKKELATLMHNASVTFSK